MGLRITRPALREAFAARGKDLDKASHQEMRSLVCAQCHVEYYFKDKYYLTFPWTDGMGVDEIIGTYDKIGFSDWVHPISKTPMLKAQHPDYELWSTGIHAFRGVSCADCHMPYRTEGGMKFTDHHVQSPLLNIANSCAVCHRWSEEEIRGRVTSIQTKVFLARNKVEDVLVRAHFDVAAALQIGVSDELLSESRKLLRHAQFRWDFISSSNGMGFHSPQESMRVLGDAAIDAQQVRILVARLLASKGIAREPTYPDTSTRTQAFQVAEAYAGVSQDAPPPPPPTAAPRPAEAPAPVLAKPKVTPGTAADPAAKPARNPTVPPAVAKPANPAAPGAKPWSPTAPPANAKPKAAGTPGNAPAKPSEEKPK